MELRKQAQPFYERIYEVATTGDIVVATNIQCGVNGSATLKRFFQERDHVRLLPANMEMEPLLIPMVEWDREWQVQGVVIAIFRQFSVTLSTTRTLSLHVES